MQVFADLLTLNYWFNSYANVNVQFVLIIVTLFFLFAFSLELALRFKYIKNNRIIVHHINSCLWIMGILLLFWDFFYYERVFLLSSRIWLVIWGGVLLLWVYFIFKYYKKIKRNHSYHIKKI